MKFVLQTLLGLGLMSGATALAHHLLFGNASGALVFAAEVGISLAAEVGISLLAVIASGLLLLICQLLGESLWAWVPPKKKSS